MFASIQRTLILILVITSVFVLFVNDFVSVAEEKGSSAANKRRIGDNLMDKSTLDALPAGKRNWVRADVLIRNGDSVGLAALLKADPGLENRRFDEPSGMTLLHRACESDQVAAIEVLLGHGAVALLKSGVFRETPLHIAARFDSVNAVKLLLDKDVDIDIVADEVEIPKTAPNSPAPVASALDVAASSGSERVAELLLKRGAKLNVNPHSRRYTALHRAMEGVYLLPGYGGASQTVNPPQKTSTGNRRIIEMLLANGGQLSDLDYLGNTPFHIGVYRLSLDCVKYVLAAHQESINVEMEGQFGFTPLQLCVCEMRTGKEKETRLMIQLLREHGASTATVGGPTSPKITPFQLATQTKCGPPILTVLQP